MEFRFNLYDFEIDFEKNLINTIVIEDNVFFRKICNELVNNIDKSDLFILSKNKCEDLSMSSNSIVISDLLNININKEINKIYKKISSIALEEKYDETLNITNKIKKYIFDILSNSNYSFTMSDTIALTDLFKSVTLKLEEEENLSYKILDYMKLLNDLTGINFFIFINLKTFFSNEEIKEIYKYCTYNKFNLILFENNISEKIENEYKIVIDKDLCEIF
ncbi:type II-A CRISPR-associated protein Csn2 [Oceanivirga salmonicida]|uniref:type II-A CRISPR-associated protein Csn2 n=1 Tax=Oceanivirga salmonicida TaxID=1769291 RepID=UPI00082F9833|nr:type II-A CRISPR-associated protein Csn2 [Oceanivirga salmonicida]